MPCDSVITLTLDLGKVDGDAFSQTLKYLGFQGTAEQFSGVFEGASFSAQLDRATGKLTVQTAYVNEARLTAALRKGHSRQIVLRQAKRAGFQVKDLQNGRLQLIKR